MSRSNVSAREKALILKAVSEKHGKLTATLVVRESDPRNTEGVAKKLSKHVGWHLQDADAAQKYREDCARAVIRSSEPELILLGVMTIESPYYVHDPTKEPGEQGYVPLAQIKTHAEVAEDTMRAERLRAVSLLRRAYAIAQALELEGDAADMLAALGALGASPVVPEIDAAGDELTE